MPITLNTESNYKSITRRSRMYHTKSGPGSPNSLSEITPKYSMDNTPKELHRRYAFEEDYVSEMRIHDNPIPIVNCLRAKADINNRRAKTNTKALEFRKIIDSRLAADVLVTERNGLNYLIPGSNEEDDFPGVLTVKVEISGPSEMVKSAVDRYLRRFEVNTDEYYAIEKHAEIDNDFHGISYICINYSISEHHLNNIGGKIYSDELDLTFELRERFSKKPVSQHPYAPDIRMSDNFKEVESKIGQQDVIIGINAVDNSKSKEKSIRFVKIGTEILKLTPKSNVNLDDGVYITTNSSYIEESEEFVNKVNVKRFTYKQADEVLGIKKSIEDAKLGDSLSNIHKAVMDNETVKLKLNEVKVKQKEQERKLKEDKPKELIEWVKLGLSIITTAISIYTLVAKVAK